jgi:hypothetical protein
VVPSNFFRMDYEVRKFEEEAEKLRLENFRCV